MKKVIVPIPANGVITVTSDNGKLYYIDEVGTLRALEKGVFKTVRTNVKTLIRDEDDILVSVDGTKLSGL